MGAQNWEHGGDLRNTGSPLGGLEMWWIRRLFCRGEARKPALQVAQTIGAGCALFFEGQAWATDSRRGRHSQGEPKGRGPDHDTPGGVRGLSTAPAMCAPLAPTPRGVRRAACKLRCARRGKVLLQVAGVEPVGLPGLADLPQPHLGKREGERGARAKNGAILAPTRAHSWESIIAMSVALSRMMEKIAKSHECCGKVARHTSRKCTQTNPASSGTAHVSPKSGREVAPGAETWPKLGCGQTWPNVAKVGQRWPELG